MKSLYASEDNEMSKDFFAENMIYLDQAATSRPKAANVGEAMRFYIESVCANINRSTYAPSTDAALHVLETREKLCALFGLDDPTHAIFTPGQTFSLNMVLKGYLHSGDHVLVSALEHNGVMRPLTQLLDCGVSFDRIPMRDDDSLDLDATERMIRPNTRLMLLTHASNVSGTILPIEQAGALCRTKGIAFAVDAAQTAGHVPIHMGQMQINALCIPGHKGLRGPSGIGALLLSPAFAGSLEPLITGGTGSDSHTEIQPHYMPDRFESGTMNLPGVYGLHAALSEFMREGLAVRQAREQTLTRRFLDGLSAIGGIRILGTRDADRRVGVVSIDCSELRDNAEVADRLASEYGILTRCGLHCAPNAHKTYGTFPQGTVRFSFNSSNSEHEIDAALDALRQIFA
ncbi:MAG: aminotransferase class V-fold PLP-dependent enzyme [Eubacteriales bacterium]|nr:aminotransferase class V-fold PLP-dependent enzyme [Eubacteriales bacterium]